MKHLFKPLLLSLALIAPLTINSNVVFAAAAKGIQDKVSVIAMNNPDQKYEVAAKLQWNASYKRWDRILVAYNGNPVPPLSHPVWSYLSNMRIPAQAGTKPGENRSYKVFYLEAYCTGVTPLANKRPMSINFENDTLGTYKQNEFFRDWNCPNWNATGMKHVTVISGNEAHAGKALRLNFPAGQVGCAERGGDACIQWKPHIGARLDKLTYSYWIKLAPNFDFAAGGRLPGIGSVTPLPESTRPNGTNGWNVGAAWKGDGTLGQYVSHMDQTGSKGDFWSWKTALSKGQWHQIKTTVKVNSPTQANGSVTTWVDGQPVLNKNGIRFRQTDKLSIERLLFNVFHSAYAPTQSNQIYIDDFQLIP